MTNSSLSSLSEPSEPPQPDPSPRPPKSTQVFGIVNPPEPYMLLPPTPVDLDDHDLALNLNSVCQRILSCKEAMWEELRRRLLLRRKGGQNLMQGLGWDDEADNDGDSSDSGLGHGDAVGPGEGRELERARERFDELTVRFERELRYRTALADALQTTLGWSKPAPSPMSRYECAREAELEETMAASALAEAEQALQCSRSFKCFVGFKEGKR